MDLERERNVYFSLPRGAVGQFEGIFPKEIDFSGYMKNPFAYLRPCASFGKYSQKEMESRTFERIFSDLKSKLVKEKELGLPIKLDWI
jgi:hypothetical protein